MSWVKHESLTQAKIACRKNLKKVLKCEQQEWKREVALSTTRFTLKAAKLEENMIDANFEARKLEIEALKGNKEGLEDKSIVALKAMAISKKVVYVMNCNRNVEMGFTLRENVQEKCWQFSHELQNHDTKKLLLEKGMDFKLKSLKKWNSVPDFVTI